MREITEWESRGQASVTLNTVKAVKLSGPDRLRGPARASQPPSW